METVGKQLQVRLTEPMPKPGLQLFWWSRQRTIARMAPVFHGMKIVARVALAAAGIVIFRRWLIA